MEGPWYRGGLRFECSGCGDCCSGQHGYVWLEMPDLRRLADFLELSLDDFGRRYLRRVGRSYSLLDDPETGDCVFLEDRRCSVHSVRPAQCRRYPFWPKILRSPRSWQQESTCCEGIARHAQSWSLAEIEALLRQ